MLLKILKKEKFKMDLHLVLPYPSVYILLHFGRCKKRISLCVPSILFCFFTGFNFAGNLGFKIMDGIDVTDFYSEAGRKMGAMGYCCRQYCLCVDTL